MDKKIVDVSYIQWEEDYAEDFTKAQKELIENGYQPYGQIHMHVEGAYKYYVLTFVKYEEDTKKNSFVIDPQSQSLEDFYSK